MTIHYKTSGFPTWSRDENFVCELSLLEVSLKQPHTVLVRGYTIEPSISRCRQSRYGLIHLSVLRIINELCIVDIHPTRVGYFRFHVPVLFWYFSARTILKNIWRTLKTCVPCHVFWFRSSNKIDWTHSQNHTMTSRTPSFENPSFPSSRLISDNHPIWSHHRRNTRPFFHTRISKLKQSQRFHHHRPRVSPAPQHEEYRTHDLEEFQDHCHDVASITSFVLLGHPTRAPDSWLVRSNSNISTPSFRKSMLAYRLSWISFSSAHLRWGLLILYVCLWERVFRRGSLWERPPSKK